MERNNREILVSTHEGIRLALIETAGETAIWVRFLHKDGFYSRFLRSVANYQIVDWGLNNGGATMPDLNRVTYVPGSRQICDGCRHWRSADQGTRMPRGKRYGLCAVTSEETFEYFYCDKYQA